MNFLEKKVINSLLPKAKDYLADFVKMAIEQSNTIPLQGDEKQHAVLLFENQGEPMWGIVTLGQKMEITRTHQSGKINDFLTPEMLGKLSELVQE